MRKYNHLVRTTCMTFNHEPYIKDALDGFAIQQTTFPVVYIIVDDASTDNNAHIIEKYLRDNFDLSGKDAFSDEDENCRRIYAQHKENKNCYFAVILLKENHYSVKRPKSPYMQEWCESPKYIAFCEGDDYWIDPHKLQKQVNYLESHQDVNLIYTNVDTYNQKTGEINESFFNKGKYRRIKNTHKDEILWGWFLAPCTWLFRDGILNSPKEKNPYMFYGDIYYVLSLSQCGEIYYLNEVTSVYRILSESASHSNDFVNKFAFWKKGRYTRAVFAAEQSVLFRMKFLFINFLVVLFFLFKDKNFKKTKQYGKIFLEEVRVVFGQVNI